MSTPTDPAPLRWERARAGLYLSGSWRVEREHYADGVTLFDWVCTNRDRNLHFTFASMQRARRAAELVTAGLGDNERAWALFAELSSPEMCTYRELREVLAVVHVAVDTTP